MKPTTKTIPLRKYAWIRYMFVNGKYIPDMSGFIDWRPVRECVMPANATFGGGWGLNNPYFLMRKPKEGKKLPILERIEWRERLNNY